MRWAELSTSVRRKKVGKKRMPGSRPDSRNELGPDTEWRFFYFSCLANWPLGHLVASQEWWLCYVRLWLIIIFSCDEYLSHLWHGQNNVENACCSITLSKLAYLYVCLFFFIWSCIHTLLFEADPDEIWPGWKNGGYIFVRVSKTVGLCRTVRAQMCHYSSIIRIAAWKHALIKLPQSSR